MNLAFFHPVFPWEGQSLIVTLLWILIPAAFLVFGIVRLLFGSRKR
jgi:hypothetical protein